MTGDMTHIWMNDNRTHVYITKNDFYKKKNQLWHMWMEPSHIYRWMTNEPTHGYTACFFFVEKGKWVMAHMNFESWHAYRWMTNVQATAQERRWCVTPMCHTHKKNWVMSHVWASHGTHMNEWRTQIFNSSHSPLSRENACVTHLFVTTQKNQSWHTYEKSRSTHMDEWPTQILSSSHSPVFGKEACVTHLSVTTQINDSWHTYEWSHSTHFYGWPTKILNSSHSPLFGKEVCMTHLICYYTNKWVMTHVWAKTWQNLNRKRLDRSRHNPAEPSRQQLFGVIAHMLMNGEQAMGWLRLVSSLK